MQFLSLLLSAIVPTALAQSPIKDYCQELHPGCGAGSAFVIQLANRVIDVVSSVVGIAAVLAFLWGAVKIITSGGGDEGRNQGKNIIIAALAGVFFALMGQILVLFVEDFVLTAVG